MGRELAGVRAEIAVLEFQCRVCRAQLGDLGQRAPARAETDQHRQHQHRHDGRNRRAETDGQTANDAGGPIGNDYRVTSREHTPFTLDEEDQQSHRARWKYRPGGSRVSGDDFITRVFGAQAPTA